MAVLDCSSEGGNLFQFPDDYGQIIPSIVAAPGTGAGNGGDNTTNPITHEPY